MKRTLSGMNAYTKMLSAEVPSQTKTYTPIKHQDIMIHVRKEIMEAGFFIAGEEYRSTAEGQIGLGLIKIKAKADPELSLCACFMNSYNKQVAFRFALGAQVHLTGNTIILENDVHGFYKRVHTGAADVLAVGKIKELISGAEDYWNALVQFKVLLMATELPRLDINHIIGQHYFQEDLLNSYQLTTIKDQLAVFKKDATINAWDVYNAVGEAMKETHPGDWVQVHVASQKIFQAQVEDAARRAGYLPALPVNPADAVFPGESTRESAEEPEHPALAQMRAAGMDIPGPTTRPNEPTAAQAGAMIGNLLQTGQLLPA